MFLPFSFVSLYCSSLVFEGAVVLSHDLFSIFDAVRHCVLHPLGIIRGGGGSKGNIILCRDLGI